MTAHVVILQETMPQYRVELFEHIRRCEARGITVEVIHGRAPGTRGQRLNTGVLPGATVIRNRYLRAPGENGAVVWQPALRRCLKADLVVVEQANRLLINYVLLLAQHLRGPKVAFWGHGRNLQAPGGSLSERFKARIAVAPWWWFAYTEGVAEHLVSRSVPRDRISVVGNTIDVAALREAVERQRQRQRQRGKPQAMARCAYLGGLFTDKRLDLLFAAADLIAERVPAFELVIAGEGEQRTEVEQFVQDRPWARYLGAITGDARAELLASTRLLLVPGLVGLVLLDSFASGVPVVTTADALHSPEIEYLDDGVNGVMVRSGADAAAYAEAVVRTLRDESLWNRLSSGAHRSAEQHTIALAAERFVTGLESAVGERRSATS